MAKTPKTTGPVQLTGVAANLFTCGAGTLAVIRSIIVTNTDNAARTYSLSVGPDATGTRIQSGTSVGANETAYLYPGITLTAGQVLQGLASVTLVMNVTINYDEVTLG